MHLESEISGRLLFLTDELKKEVLDFVDFLVSKTKMKSQKKSAIKPHFKWEGALRNMKKKYTSVELQHKIWEL